MRPATADRQDVRALFGALSRSVRALDPAAPTSASFTVDASAPAGVPAIPALPAGVVAALRGPLADLRALDAAMCLDRDPDGGVWETLQLEYHGHSRRSWLVVSNAMGHREHVTTWAFEQGQDGVVADWDACRASSALLATSWDVARRERRVVDMKYEGPCLIDRGANRIIDIVASMGGATYTSCEGHPWGAYVGWLNGPASIRETMATLGWSIETDGPGTVARMPDCLDVSSRDSAWRAACAALEELAVSRAPDPANPTPRRFPGMSRRPGPAPMVLAGA